MNSSEVSVGGWILSIILSCIPVVGIICLIIWAIGNSGKKNWAIAQLILIVVIYALSFFAYRSFMAAFI